MKTRLDVYLTEQGYFPTREKARAAIMEDLVFVDGQRSDKAGNMISEDAHIEIKGDVCPYVSRGGYKLEKALDVFGIDVRGLSCIDIGSSTGGFTDCMLQRGASSVCAVDVGTNQLDYKLRIDERVDVKEKYNFRYAKEEDFKRPYDFACTDVSIISLKHILSPASSLLKDGSYMVCLIKPQFEAGREQVGKKGIIKDKSVHKEVIEKVIKYAQKAGFKPLKLDHSPVKGTKGNIEFLIMLEKNTDTTISDEIDIDAVVEAAHMEE